MSITKPLPSFNQDQVKFENHLL